MKVIATGTWLYDGKVPSEINLLAEEVSRAQSRWTENDTGEFVIDESTPIPETINGLVYYIGATSGGDFTTLQAAIDWANGQKWGPVE